MSIIMGAAEQTRQPSKTHRTDLLNDPLRQLLDHVAAELAEEYVRLMEASAGISQVEESDEP